MKGLFWKATKSTNIHDFNEVMKEITNEKKRAIYMVKKENLLFIHGHYIHLIKQTKWIALRIMFPSVSTIGY